MLVGLKSDLRHKKNCIELLRTQGLTPVTTEQGQSVAQRMGASYMECSAREMTGVQAIFDNAINIAVGDEYRLHNSSYIAGSTNGLGTKRKKHKSCKIL